MAVGTVSSLSPNEWQLISSASLTSGTSSSFTGLSGYKTYMLAFKNVTTSANSYLVVRFNNDTSTGAYAAGSDGYTYQLLSHNIAAEGRAGAAIIHDADKAVPHKLETTSYSAGFSMSPTFYTDPVAITRIDLVSRESQAFTAGTVYLYGIAA
jgi:hypothetical protein